MQSVIGTKNKINLRPSLWCTVISEKKFTRFLSIALACCVSLAIWLAGGICVVERQKPCKYFFGNDCTSYRIMQLTWIAILDKVMRTSVRGASPSLLPEWSATQFTPSVWIERERERGSEREGERNEREREREIERKWAECIIVYANRQHRDDNWKGKTVATGKTLQLQQSLEVAWMLKNRIHKSQLLWAQVKRNQLDLIMTLGYNIF